MAVVLSTINTSIVDDIVVAYSFVIVAAAVA